MRRLLTSVALLAVLGGATALLVAAKSAPNSAKPGPSPSPSGSLPIPKPSPS